ncbi:hypothetical protein BJX62DRAFT_244632 [Aspergillus germanicus]
MGWQIGSDNRMGRGFMATIISLLIFDLFCVLIRLYARYLQKSRPVLSDYILIWGFVSCNDTGYVVCSICIFTILRLVVSYHYKTHNLTVQNAISMFLSGLEPTLGIIIACLPFFPVFIARVHRGYRGSFLSLDSGTQSRSGNQSSADDTFGGRNGNSIENGNGYSAAIITDSLSAPRYPSLVGSSAPLRGAKDPHQHQYETQGSAYQLETLSVIDYSSELGIDAGVVGLRDGRAEEWRIYITRGFEIQSHSPKSRYGQGI